VVVLVGQVLAALAALAAVGVLLHNQAVLAQAVKVIMAVTLQLQMMVVVAAALVQ
jgi:hypothetical protein